MNFYKTFTINSKKKEIHFKKCNTYSTFPRFSQKRVIKIQRKFIFRDYNKTVNIFS